MKAKYIDKEFLLHFLRLGGLETEVRVSDLMTAIEQMPCLTMPEANRVLTLEEMESADDPVWLERKGNTHIVVADTCIGQLWRDGRCVCHAYTIARREAWCFYEDEYQETWRCWLNKPTPEERAATPWKETEA